MALNNFNKNQIPSTTPSVAPTTPNALNNSVPPELINYNQLAKKGNFNPVLFREDIIDRMLSVLNTVNHPNVLLLGEAGVGKTGVVEELARRLVNKDPLTVDALGAETKIYELPISNLIAGKGIVGQLESAINQIIAFASNPKNHVILYIDEIHQLFSSSDNSENKIAQMLKPALSRRDLHVIASTTSQESQDVKKDPAFIRRYSEILLPELNNAQTEKILTMLAPKLEQHHHVKIDMALLPKVVTIANEYNVNSHRPDTAISLLDRASADTHIKALKIATGTNLKINVPMVVSEHQVKKSALTLLNINSNASDQPAKDVAQNLSAHIIGQKKAVKAVTETVQRMALGLTPLKRPHSFLFAGPTGTGKTEIAKQLAKGLFGSEDDLITLNMTEYAENMSISRILGSTPGFIGYDNRQPLPLDPLKANPFKIVLLDELEKASPNVQQLFMRALDEGSIKTNREDVISFKHAIIIATTNAGADAFGHQTIGFSNATQAPHDDHRDVLNILSRDFKPELLNRFEHVIAFTPIDPTDYKQILKIKYNRFVKQMHVQRPDLVIDPNELDMDQDYPFIDRLASDSYDPLTNGRPAERTIQNFIEDLILNHSNNTVFNVPAMAND